MKCILLTLLFSLILFACNNSQTNTVKEKNIDSILHGYNELTNTNKERILTVSDYNTDNPEIQNIDRPSVSIIQTNLDTILLFDIWVNDTSAPHADFNFSSLYFDVTDYDGNGSMPYELLGSQLKIYYNDFIQNGEIVSINKDTLKIKWQDFNEATSYVRWRF